MNEHLLHLRNAHLIDPKKRPGCAASICSLSMDASRRSDEPPTGFAAERPYRRRKGLIACPGLVDLSTRLGGIETELAAAVAGGVTSLACPPDSKPPLDEPGLVERLVRRSETLGLARVYPIGALTQQLAGEKLAEMNTPDACRLYRLLTGQASDRQHAVAAAGHAVRRHFRLQGASAATGPVSRLRRSVAHDGEVASRLGPDRHPGRLPRRSPLPRHCNWHLKPASACTLPAFPPPPAST
jgi:dihydroorotase